MIKSDYAYSLQGYKHILTIVLCHKMSPTP